MPFTIKEDSPNEAYEISLKIPEFSDPYKIDEYQQRLNHRDHLVLLAFDNSERKAVGFKVGYELTSDIFYSWMGGVLPKYRRHGIAESLANYQEDWARKRHYKIIQMKTREKHKAMIAFSLRRGFIIKSRINNQFPAETRLIMEKLLLNKD
ncbi:GNAT family N-acetyltransferase [Candidatus Neomarinimicrobiota bacterium]